MSDVFTREKSLAGSDLAKELAKIGGCRDEKGNVACYMCDLTLNADDIIEIGDDGKFNSFVEAGLFFHAREKPWCGFLHNLPKKDRKRLLGERICFINYMIFS